MSDTIFGTNVPATTDASDGTNYTMGTRFRPSEDGFITKARWYGSITPPVAGVLPLAAQLWDERDTSAPIATTTFGTLTASVWNETDFSSPVYVQAGITYTISVVTNRYTATTHYFDDPITSGYLFAPAAAGRFQDITSSTTPVYPTNAFNAGGYFVDVVFNLGSPPAPGGFSVWDGSTEHDGLVTVWNSSSEVPMASFEVV